MQLNLLFFLGAVFVMLNYCVKVLAKKGKEISLTAILFIYLFA